MHVDKCPNVLWKYFFKICLAIFQNYVWNGYAISSIALPPQKRDLLPKHDLLQIVHSFSRFLFEQFFPQRTYSTVSSRSFSTFATSMHTKTDKNELMGKGRCGSVRLRLKREGRRFDIQWALSRVHLVMWLPVTIKSKGSFFYRMSEAVLSNIKTQNFTKPCKQTRTEPKWQSQSGITLNQIRGKLIMMRLGWITSKHSLKWKNQICLYMKIIDW